MTEATLTRVLQQWHAEPNNGSLVDLGLRVLDAYRRKLEAGDSGASTRGTAREWFWVSSDGREWFPAYHDPAAAGGWSNGDTWEDWERAIKYSVPIAPPMPLTEDTRDVSLTRDLGGHINSMTTGERCTRDR